MIQYYIHEKMILDASKSYQTIYDTINKAEPELQNELDSSSALRDSSFQSFVIYLIIGPYDNEKVDLLNIL